MTIGEFSQRSGLSPKVLRTYAEVGVLVPATIDEASGYRYYAPISSTTPRSSACFVELASRLPRSAASLPRRQRTPSPGGSGRWSPRSSPVARRSPKCDADSPLTVLPAKESP